MSFSRNFYELFIKPEDEGIEWQEKVFELIGNGDIRGLDKHLKQANEVYYVEKELYTAINAFTLESKTQNEKGKLLKSLLKHGFAESVEYNDETIKIKAKNGILIMGTKLSGLIRSLNYEDEYVNKENRHGNCHYKSIKISKSLEMPNDLVTGYVYGISDKTKFLHSWVEFEVKGKELVIDYTLNIIMNKEGYYYLQHARPLSRISNEDLVNDDEYIRKFNKLGHFNIKEYLTFRDEIVNDFKKNQKLFDEER